MHYWSNLRKNSKSKNLKKVEKNYWSDIRAKSIKKSQAKRRVEKKSLDEWYQEMRKRMQGTCRNCGAKSMRDNDAMYKWSICHILPKKPDFGFPSVATNLYNFWEGCVECHSKFDSNWETAYKMQVWPEVKFKFKLFQSEIAPEEQSRIPECFLK